MLTGHLIRAVLFDLDGTLLDTAADLTVAVNNVLALHRRAPYNQAFVAETISQGTGGIISAAFAVDAYHPQYNRYKQELIQAYHIQLHTASKTRLFPGIALMLTWLQQHAIPWGIVTNKPFWLANLLLQTLQLSYPPRCLIGHETLLHRKPHPFPLLYASQLIGIPPAAIVYIGDAASDIAAANAASMYSVAAAYGYLTALDQPEEWGGDYITDSPVDFLNWLQLRI